MGHATAFLALSPLNPGERSKGQISLISFFNHKTISMVLNQTLHVFLHTKDINMLKRILVRSPWACLNGGTWGAWGQKFIFSLGSNW